MTDDFLTDSWARNRRALHHDIDKLRTRIMAAFDVLNRIQFAAPWQAGSRPDQHCRSA